MRLGVDPGITGAIALISGRDVLDCRDMPTYEYTTGAGSNKKKRRTVDFIALNRIFMDIKDKHKVYIEVVLERQQHNMGAGFDSPMTAFTVGFNYGKTISAVESVFQESYRVVHPASWKNKASLKKATKNNSIDLCVKEFNTNNFVTLKKHHGRAEAILIAFYGI